MYIFVQKYTNMNVYLWTTYIKIICSIEKTELSEVQNHYFTNAIIYIKIIYHCF